MARAKKPVNDGMMQVDIDSFVRTRDSLVTGLATLTDAIQTLSSVYIKHTNAILGEHGSGLDVESALGKLADNPLFQSGGELQPATPPVAKSAVAESSTAAAGGKVERKKRLHDPNAPKRPLTPFFLFMQTARSVITKDFGENPAKGAISAEGTRRWQEMPPKDKILWTKVYKENLRLYNARMHAYKNGDLLAKDMDEESAMIYADLHNIPAPAETPDEQIAGESAAAAALPEEDAEGEAEPEPEQEPTPPPKTPKAKAGGRKSKAAAKSTPVASTPAAEPEAIVPPASASSNIIVPPAKEDSPEKKKSPEKKRKRVSKKTTAEEAAEEAENEEAIETPKSAPKPRKKKAKASDA